MAAATPARRAAGSRTAIAAEAVQAAAVNAAPPTAAQPPASAAANGAARTNTAGRVVLHGIPNCDTVKKARVWLESHGVDFVFHDYKKAGIDAATLRAWLERVPLDTLLNRRGTTWRALPEARKASAAEPAGAIAIDDRAAISHQAPGAGRRR